MVQTGVMKRRMTMDRALRWAFCEELPKVQSRTAALVGPSAPPSPSSHVSEVGRLGAEVDGGVNFYGVSPFDVWMGDVHEDALVIGDTVAGLEPRDEDWSDCLELIIDLGADDLMLQALARAASRCRIIDLADLVRREAILSRLCPPVGARADPSWQSEVPERKLLTTANGLAKWFMRRQRTVAYSDGKVGVEWEEIAVVGRKNGPPAGAYRKWALDPIPDDVLIERIRHTAWLLTVSAMAEALQGALSEIEIEPWTALSYPWIEGRHHPAALRPVRGWPNLVGVVRPTAAPPRRRKRTNA